MLKPKFYLHLNKFSKSFRKIYLEVLTDDNRKLRVPLTPNSELSFFC